MTLVWGIVLALLGLIHWGPVLVAGLTITSITYGAMLGVFLLGTWNRRANESGTLVGFVTGLALMLGVARFTPLAWTWYVFVGTIVTDEDLALSSATATIDVSSIDSNQPFRDDLVGAPALQPSLSRDLQQP